MLLAKYLQKSYLQMAIIVSLATAVLVLCIGVMSELRQSTTNYSFLDALWFIIQTLPANFSRFYPAALALAAVAWVWRLREQQELLMAHAMGLSRTRIITSLSPMLLICIGLCTLNMEWLAPNLASHAKQVQALKLTRGQVINTQESMWFRIEDGFLHARPTQDPKILNDIHVYKLQGGRIHGWAYADLAKWDGKSWQVDELKQYRLKKTSQVHTSKKTTVLPLQIKPSLLSKTAYKSDYMSLTQMWHGLTDANHHGVLNRLSWTSFWLRVLAPLHTWVLLTLVLTWLQISLDLRSSTFSITVLAVILVIIVDFSCIEILEHLHVPWGMWSSFWLATTPLWLLTLGTIGGMHVRD